VPNKIRGARAARILGTTDAISLPRTHPCEGLKLLGAGYGYHRSKGNTLSLRLSNRSQPTHRQLETRLEHPEFGEFQQEEFQRGAGMDIGARE
jgi:hypothetical protein